MPEESEDLEDLEGMQYEHRMMRCKVDRSALIKGRRYRPGEILEEGHEPTEDFEPYDPPVKVEPPKPAPPVRADRVEPEPGEMVRMLTPNAEEPYNGD